MRTVLQQVGALAALAATASCAHPAAQAAPLTAVAVETARPGSSGAAYIGPATVQPVHTYRIGFEIPGRVLSVFADVGDRVDAGATLATIDAASYRAQLAAAAAQADAASAQAARAQHGSRPEEVIQAHDGVARAQAAFDLANASERRYAQLYAQGAISAQAYDQAVQALRDARAALDAAHAQASLAQQGPREEDRAAASADAFAARAQAQLASVTLAKTSITAPADAYEQSRSIEPGSMAEPGAIAFVLTDAREPQLYADVPERIASSLHLGDRATAIVDGDRHSATIVRIEPMADATTHTRQVRLEVSGIAPSPGAVARVELGRDRRGGANVPVGSIVTRGNAHAVVIYDDTSKQTHLREVRILSTDGDRATVSGIGAGTAVVVAGQYSVRDGESVRLVSKDGAQ